MPAVEDFEDEVARSAAFGVHGFDPDEIGSRFADIFRNNSANNGLLLAQVDPKVVGELWDFAEQHPGEQLTLSLENRTINLPGRTTYPFHIDDVTRQRLLAGLDAVGETLDTQTISPHMRHIGRPSCRLRLDLARLSIN
ncbi:putative 3-isopropylmalate dehydratase large subunit [Cutibacterium acnes C1]|nr:putative 3-isopropylmalate dehydratase large subunit [Cutibacterium acnes C1]